MRIWCSCGWQGEAEKTDNLTSNLYAYCPFLCPKKMGNNIIQYKVQNQEEIELN